MPRSPALTSREVVRALRILGFELSRQAGTSHAIFYRASDKRRTVVPMHAGKTLKRRTLAAIIRDTGLDVDGFLRVVRS